MADNRPLAVESRTVATVYEFREADATAPVIEGYAATFNQPYDLGAFREQIDPTAFNRTLGASPDVRLLIDHTGQPIGRSTGIAPGEVGCLELSADSTGLHMRAKLDASDPDVQRVLPKLRRGILREMSFGFRVPKGGDTWENDLRTLRNIEMNGGDVSVVTYPANTNTNVALRSRDDRDAQFVYLQHIMDEVRAGSMTAENVAKLKHVLSLIAAADNAVDMAQPLLADVLGVPNPDKDEAAEGEPPAMPPSGARALRAALAAATALGL